MALYDPAPFMHYALAASKLGVSVQQARNFHALALHLYALPDDYDHFDMSRFFGEFGAESTTHPGTDPAACGTVACALGHAPLVLGHSLPTGQWLSYAEDHFGMGVDAVKFDFFFAGEWDAYDPTPRGAAQRILYGLRHGVPQCYYDSHDHSCESAQTIMEEDVIPLYQAEHP